MFPAEVVPSLLETFVNVPESLTMGWWEDMSNVGKLCKRAIFAAYPEGSPAREMEDLIRDAIGIFKFGVMSTMKASELSFKESGRILDRIRQEGKHRSDSLCSTSERGAQFPVFHLSTV